MPRQCRQNAEHYKSGSTPQQPGQIRCLSSQIQIVDAKQRKSAIEQANTQQQHGLGEMWPLRPEILKTEAALGDIKEQKSTQIEYGVEKDPFARRQPGQQVVEQ